MQLLARWWLIFEEYPLKFKHQPGKEHVALDTLSQLQSKQDGLQDAYAVFTARLQPVVLISCWKINLLVLDPVPPPRNPNIARLLPPNLYCLRVRESERVGKWASERQCLLAFVFLCLVWVALAKKISSTKFEVEVLLCCYHVLYVLTYNNKKIIKFLKEKGKEKERKDSVGEIIFLLLNFGSFYKTFTNF